MAEGTLARVLVAGGAGYAGALATKLVARHPRLELAAATARSDAGRRLAELYPRHGLDVELVELDPSSPPAAEAAIVAYPHGAAAPVVRELRRAGMLVVDLSADFRLADAAVHERTYGEHGAPELRSEAVYGLPELHRSEIAGSELVANPGCYPVATLLALAPLAEAGLIEEAFVDAKSGVSGAGRGGGDRLSFVSVTENVTPYGVTAHRHEPEIAEQLALAGGPDALSFVPHLVPIDQGLLASCQVVPSREVGEAELTELYAERYREEPWVTVRPEPPGARDVRETNLCHVHATVHASTGRLLAFGAIDNLWKGASSQAIQNLNLMLGLDEEEGLR